LNTFPSCRQLRREFLAQGPPPPKLNPPKPNKYLTASRRNSSSATSDLPPTPEDASESPATTTAATSTTSESAIVVRRSWTDDAVSSSSGGPGDSDGGRMALSPEEAHFMSDTVEQEELPRVHHAEVVSVRKEAPASSSSSSSSSSASHSDTSDDDEERSVSSRNIMINIKPVAEPGAASSTDGSGSSSEGNTEQQQVTPRLDAPPQKQNIWGATRQKTSPASRKQSGSVPPLIAGDDEADFREQQQQLTEKYFPEPENFSYEQMQLYREEMKDLPCSTPREEEPEQQDSPPMPELLPARGHFGSGGCLF